MKRRPTLLALALGAASAALGADLPLVFEDARGDDRGPGSYLPPTGSVYREGDFDLRRFSVSVEGEEAVFEVTLGAPVRRDIVRQRTNASELDLTNGIFVQHVDIYIDHLGGAGFTEGLPGRRIAFSAEEAWDVAISLTPRPAPTRRILEAWNRPAADRVVLPSPLRSRGATIVARVPLWRLGGAPKPTWGYAVTVSGAVWERGFDTVDRLRGQHTPDAFTLPVYSVPEEHAFGGARLGGGHPNVVDVLVPPGASQERVLGDFGPGNPARVPMVYAERPAVQLPVLMPPELSASRPSPAPEPEPRVSLKPPLTLDPVSPEPGATILEIANVQGDTVVIPSPRDLGLKEWLIGTVIDGEGRQLGRVVITSVSPGFVLATITDGKALVRPGARVRFPAARPPDDRR